MKKFKTTILGERCRPYPDQYQTSEKIKTKKRNLEIEKIKKGENWKFECKSEKKELKKNEIA